MYYLYNRNMLFVIEMSYSRFDQTPCVLHDINVKQNIVEKKKHRMSILVIKCEGVYILSELYDLYFPWRFHL